MGVDLNAKVVYLAGGISEQAMPVDRTFMERALELGRQARGQTSPNPMVGAVIVHDGVVVGEGVHRGAGSSHAEVEAIAAAGVTAAGSTLYVTLEPCNHEGRTGPCAEAILEAGITKVFFATPDPAEHRSEKGRDRLLRAGLRVVEGPCGRDARFENRFFLHFCAQSRPWVIAKFASSLDGRISTGSGESQWITGDIARERAHELRSLVDAVVVGSGTVLTDDPQLSVRLTDFKGKQPTRIVLDSRGRTPTSAKLLADAEATRTIMATTNASSVGWREKVSQQGAELLLVRADASGRLLIPDLLDELRRLEVQSLMVEGGAAILGAFFDARLVDEVWAFIAPMLLGGADAPGAIGGSGVSTLEEAFRLEDIRTEALGPDLLIRGLVQKKEVLEPCLQEL